MLRRQDAQAKASQLYDRAPRCRCRRLHRNRASKLDCDVCALKPKCCPVTPMRKIMHSKHEGARCLARAIATTSAYLVSHRERKRVKVLFVHLKAHSQAQPPAPAKPYGAKDEFHLAAAAQSLRKLAELHLIWPPQ